MCSSRHCNTAPFDNNDLRLALKYAIDREEMVQKILMGYGTVGNDTPINKAYPLFTEIEQREYDPDKAAFHYKKSGHSGRCCCAPPTSPSRARSTPPHSISRAPRRPASPSRSSASRATATGPKSGTSSRSRPPIGAAVRRRTRCIRTAYSRRPTGTTPASAPGFRQDAVPGPRRTRRTSARQL